MGQPLFCKRKKKLADRGFPISLNNFALRMKHQWSFTSRGGGGGEEGGAGRRTEAQLNQVAVDQLKPRQEGARSSRKWMRRNQSR